MLVRSPSDILPQRPGYIPTDSCERVWDMVRLAFSKVTEDLCCGARRAGAILSLAASAVLTLRTWSAALKKSILAEADL